MTPSNRPKSTAADQRFKSDERAETKKNQASAFQNESKRLARLKKGPDAVGNLRKTERNFALTAQHGSGLGLPASVAVRNDEPQPHVAIALGLKIVNPPDMPVSL